MLNDSKERLQTTVPNSNCNTSSSTEKIKLSGNDIPLPAPKLSAPTFLKKAKTQEANVGIDKTQEKHTPMVDDVDKSKTTEGETAAAAEVNSMKVGEMPKAQQSQLSNRPSNPFLKRSNCQDIEKKEEVDQVKPHRPSNPFLKKSVK